jgi:hypothetical protein
MNKSRFSYRETRTQINPVSGTAGTKRKTILETNCNFWRLEIWYMTGGRFRFGGLVVNNALIGLRPSLDENDFRGRYEYIESGVCRPDTWIVEPIVLADVPDSTNSILGEAAPLGDLTNGPFFSIVLVRGYFDDFKR